MMVLSCSKELSALLRVLLEALLLTSKHYGDFYCLKKKFELYKKLYENKDFCNVIVPSEDTKI